MAISMNINGEIREVEAEQGTPLLWVIRDELKLTGTKFGCGVASCGACTVHIDGEPVRSCQTFVEDISGSEITTIEKIGEGKVGAAIQQAWEELDVVQCGYCQPGQIMSAVALLADHPDEVDDALIDSAMAGNICRCGTYPRIRAAIKAAARA